MKEGFILHCSYYPTIQLLNMRQKGELLDAFFLYHIDGKEPEIKDPQVKVAFSFIKQQFDRETEKYIKTVERNRLNGQNGGRPKGTHNNPENPVGYFGNPKKPRKADTDTDTDTDTNILKEIHKEKDWRSSFEVYRSEAKQAYESLLKDPEYLSEKKHFHPNVDIPLSIEKCFVEYWGTEAGWKQKKKSKTKEINWKSTFTNALNLKSNQVYETKQNSQGYTKQQFTKQSQPYELTK